MRIQKHKQQRLTSGRAVCRRATAARPGPAPGVRSQARGRPTRAPPAPPALPAPPAGSPPAAAHAPPGGTAGGTQAVHRWVRQYRWVRAVGWFGCVLRVRYRRYGMDEGSEGAGSGGGWRVQGRGAIHTVHAVQAVRQYRQDSC